MRLVMHHTDKRRTKSAGERKLIGERIAQRVAQMAGEDSAIAELERKIDDRDETIRRLDRPQAKGTARRAFEAWYGPCPPRTIFWEQRLEYAWIIWQAAWRAARGAKPTTRLSRASESEDCDAVAEAVAWWKDE